MEHTNFLRHEVDFDYCNFLFIRILKQQFHLSSSGCITLGFDSFSP